MLYALFKELSASRTRRSRACWRVDNDSLMRATASLSGPMLKLPIVWWMSCVLSIRMHRVDGGSLLSRDLRQEAF